MDHYEWNGWLWCEREGDAFTYQTGEVECPHCGFVLHIPRALRECHSCGEVTTSTQGVVGEDIQAGSLRDGSLVHICDECGGVH